MFYFIFGAIFLLVSFETVLVSIKTSHLVKLNV